MQTRRLLAATCRQLFGVRIEAKQVRSLVNFEAVVAFDEEMSPDRKCLIHSRELVWHSMERKRLLRCKTGAPERPTDATMTRTERTARQQVGKNPSSGVEKFPAPSLMCDLFVAGLGKVNYLVIHCFHGKSVMNYFLDTVYGDKALGRLQYNRCLL